MAYTQADVDALKAAMAKGVKRLRMNGEEVEFASMSEMRRQLQDMEAELSGTATGGIAVIYPRTTRGL